MAKAHAIAHRMADRTAEAARALIVAGCALALIAAGQAFPL